MKDQGRQEAVLPLEEIVAKDPTTALYLPLAERLRERGRLDEAIRLCEERRLRPGNGVGDRIVLGRAYLADGRLAEARAEFHAALSLDRENVVALKALAGILSHLGNHAEAASYYRAVCRVDPGDLESQTALHQITSGEYPECPPDVVVDQGDLGWQPVRLPREEEHISELALGLHTIDRFDSVAPAPYRAVIQDFQDVPLERRGVAEPAPVVESAHAESDLAVETISPVESPTGTASANRSEQAPATAPVQASPAATPGPGPVVAGNRSAFELWLRRIGGKDQ